MDVHCSTYSEPWDVYHLQHEAIHETGLTTEEAKAWSQMPKDVKMNTRYRQEFRDAGWEFGGSVINVTRCPACPKGATPDPEKVAIKAEIESLMSGDTDGLASELETLGL